MDSSLASMEVVRRCDSRCDSFASGHIAHYDFRGWLAVELRGSVGVLHVQGAAIPPQQPGLLPIALRDAVALAQDIGNLLAFLFRNQGQQVLAHQALGAVHPHHGRTSLVDVCEAPGAFHRDRGWGFIDQTSVPAHAAIQLRQLLLFLGDVPGDPAGAHEVAVRIHARRVQAQEPAPELHVHATAIRRDDADLVALGGPVARAPLVEAVSECLQVLRVQDLTEVLSHQAAQRQLE